MQRDEAEQIIYNVVSRFKEMRLEANISHETLADRCNLHRSTISLIESRKNQPTLLTCLLIADALDADISKIIDEAKR